MTKATHVSEINSKIIKDVLKSNKDFDAQNSNNEGESFANKFESIGDDLVLIYESQIKPLASLVSTTNTSDEPLNNRTDFFKLIFSANEFFRKLELQSKIQITASKNSVNDLSKKVKQYIVIIEKINGTSEN